MSRIRVRHGKRTNRFRTHFLILCWTLLWIAFPARATVWDPFSGIVDISAVQSETDDLDQETLRQQYNLNFNQKLSPWVDLRLSARYFKFDQEIELLLGGYREEWQPSGELRWNHPLFNFTTSAFHREVTTSARGEIITDDFQTSVKTVDTRYPTVELRYDQQHSYSPDIPDEADIKNSRFLANADYWTEHHIFHYSYGHTVSKNVVSNQEATVDRNLFRWEGIGKGFSDGRLNLNGRYTFNYATQSNQTFGDGRILELAPINVGLYVQDFAPDLGALETRVSLADGNKTDPSLPLIDMGAGGNGHNIGADLGIAQAVGGIYIYTDRPSGSQPRWEVYGSTDNLDWQLMTGAPNQFFNPALNRYELTFPTADFRFVKAVNTGQNEIALVYVTEIEVLREIPQDSNQTSFSSASHTLDGRATYTFNERWMTSLDASLQAEENIGRRGDKNRWALGWRVLFEQSQKVSHHFRWDLSRLGGQTPQPQLMDNGVGYTMTVDPMETIRGTFSVSDRISYLDGARSQNILGTVAEVNAAMLPDLNLSVGGGMSWFDEYILDASYDTWNVRGGVDAGIFNSLDLILDYNYQETREEDEPGVRVRQLASLGFDWRVTRDVYARASIRKTRQNFTVWTQDYLVSWTILPSLRLNGQMFEIVQDDATTSLRKSANLNWELTNRSTIYFRVADVDFTGTGGTRTVSFQQGFRLTF